LKVNIIIKTTCVQSVIMGVNPHDDTSHTPEWDPCITRATLHIV